MPVPQVGQEQVHMLPSQLQLQGFEPVPVESTDEAEQQDAAVSGD